MPMLFQFQNKMQIYLWMLQLVLVVELVWLLVKIHLQCCLFLQKFLNLHCYLKEELKLTERVINMVAQMDEEGFGNCTNTGACEVECPKGISLENIARMNREYLKASI